MKMKKNKDHKGVADKLINFAKLNGYLPQIYQPYNNTEITDLSPTITSHVGQGGWDSSSQLMICEPNVLKLNKGETMNEKTIEPTDRCIQTATLKINDFDRAKRVYSDEGIAGTVTTNYTHDSKIDTHLRIRKLTPKECFRLMGFDDNDYQKCVDIGFGSSALYHVAGDSIITTVLASIIGEMTDKEYREIIDRYADSLAERKEL